MTTDIVVDTTLKLTCARTELAERLAIVGRGLSMRPTVQIFAGVLMDRFGLPAQQEPPPWRPDAVFTVPAGRRRHRLRLKLRAARLRRR